MIGNDKQFREFPIVKVEEDPTGWTIYEPTGWAFTFCKPCPVDPKVGMRARLYGEGVGLAVRGLTIDGKVIFYKTAADQEAEIDRRLTELWTSRRKQFSYQWPEYTARLDALPEPLRAEFLRICPFSPREIEFRLLYLEGANQLMKRFPTHAELRKWVKLSVRQRMEMVPELSVNHTPETIGYAYNLAWRLTK